MALKQHAVYHVFREHLGLSLSAPVCFPGAAAYALGAAAMVAGSLTLLDPNRRGFFCHGGHHVYAKVRDCDERFVG